MTAARLAGKRVVVTRARHQAAPLVQALEAEGAEVLVAPAIAIVPPEDGRPLDDALRKLDGFQWMIVTSQNAVDAVFDRLEALDLGLPAGLAIAAVGAKTEAALIARGAGADVIPERHVSEALFDALRARTSLSGQRFFLPRADIAGDELRQRLVAAGAEAQAVTAYRTVRRSGRAIAEALGRVEAGDIDAVTFTSASTVEGFLGDAPRHRLAGRFEPASIGPVTTRALVALGYDVAIEAEPSTVEGLVAAIVNFYEPAD